MVGQVNGLPASERFFAGGDTSVRGFALDRLGNESTISSTGFPDRREQRRGAEQRAARHVCSAHFRAIGFLDAGNVFPLASDLSFIDLRPARDSAWSIKSQRIGLVRVDLGFNLNPQEFVPGARERRRVMHFLLGQPF